MRSLRIYRLICVFAAIVFVWLQSAALVHAAQYGEETHEHNGISCSVALHLEEVGDVLPVSVKIYAPFVKPLETAYFQTDLNIYVIPQSRAPPPRGPPNLI